MKHEEIKDLTNLILHLDYSSKVGVVKLKTLTGTVLARGNTQNECLQQLFKFLGLNLVNYELDIWTLQHEGNKLLKEAGANYEVYYAGEVNKYVDLLHLKKINN